MEMSQLIGIPRTSYSKYFQTLSATVFQGTDPDDTGFLVCLWSLGMHHH